jgi:hypothetical protein
MSDNTTFDPKLFVVNVAGFRVTGFANDTGYSSTMDEDFVTTVVGNNGLGAYVFRNSRAATISLTLMPGSNDNDKFMAAVTADRLTPGGVLVPIFVTQQNGRFNEGGFGRFVRWPDGNIAASVTPVVWTFKSLNFVKYIGGQDETPVVSTIEELNALIAAANTIQAPS